MEGEQLDLASEVYWILVVSHENPDALGQVTGTPYLASSIAVDSIRPFATRLRKQAPHP